MMEPLTAPPDRFNFAQHLIELNAGRGRHPAYIDDQGVLGYDALFERVRRFATALKAIGLKREERVLLAMHDCNDWPVAFLGCLYAGVVPVAVNTLLSATDYAFMLEHSRVQAAFVSASLLPTLQRAMEDGGHELVHLVVSRPEAGTALPSGAVEFDTFVNAQAPAAKPAATGAEEMAFWLYSSGSTGRPKGTVHTHANLWWTQALFGGPVLQLRADDVCFSAAKLFFAYGLGNGLTFPLSVGATVVLMAERPTPEATFKRWVQHRPTVFFGAPTGYAGMLASPGLPSREQVALRLCSSAGEALPREIGERFRERFGADIVDGIGSTEMLHVFISNRPDDIRYGSTGKPVPGYEIELRDEHGHVIDGHGQVGDLFVKGPSAALFYWHNRSKTRDTFRGAWTSCGDKYSRDADGYYIYAGRGDDMLKVSGQYVSPFEVESTLQQHADVLEAAVIGIPDANGLTRAKAYVVLKDASAAGDGMAQALKDFVKQRLAPHKYPRLIEFVSELPKTATGKIQRFRLRERESA